MWVMSRRGIVLKGRRGIVLKGRRGFVLKGRRGFVLKGRRGIVLTCENKVNSFSNQLEFSWVCKSEWSLTMK